MPKFRLRKDAQSVSLFQPSRSPDAFVVEPGQTAEVPGEFAKNQPDDAYIVGEGDSARAWPKAIWELAEEKPVTKAAPVKEG